MYVKDVCPECHSGKKDEFTRVWYKSHMRAANAQASLCMHRVSTSLNGDLNYQIVFSVTNTSH